MAAAPPALADALPTNTKGSCSRASCHTGTDVSATSTAVYVHKGRPNIAAPSSPRRPIGRSHPVTSDADASPRAPPNTESTQLPTLIGDVGLKTRSML